MGNTVLAHVLYATNNSNLDLDNFFNKLTGDAHKIYNLNCTELTAEHLDNYIDSETQCILQLRSDEWFYVLQHRMSYFKWHNSVPTLLNLDTFFEIEFSPVDITNSWIEYYTAVRDPSWPECNSFDEIDKLPEFIQHEIRASYQLPNRKLVTESNLVEFLTQTYYDILVRPYFPKFDAPVYNLSDYFAKKTQVLENIANQLGWKWDQHRSHDFHSVVLQTNRDHLDWLEGIKKIHNDVVNLIPSSVDLAEWERALVIAKVCETVGCNPKQLHWQDNDCFLESNNVTLLNVLQGKNNDNTPI